MLLPGLLKFLKITKICMINQPISVILLRQESTLSTVEKEATKRSHRPIGLAKDEFQVSPHFFDELPEDLLDAFEGKK